MKTEILSKAIHSWRQLLDARDLRVVFFVSLFLQTFLFFSAPLRKRVSTPYVVMAIWLAYTLVDSIVSYASRLVISNRVSDSSSSGGPSSANPELVAFWASFLLIHLGCPDTITAFALEDNELWRRYVNQLVTQWSFPASISITKLYKTKLLLPNSIIIVAGLLKYTVRVRSLYLASFHGFRQSLLTKPDPGPNYAKLIDVYFSKKEANLPTQIEIIQEPKRIPKATHDQDKLTPLTDLEVVQHAYRFFQTFKGLIVDLIFSFRERDQSRTFFLNRTAREAFKVVEVELNFFYEILYTKAQVLQSKFGYFLRLVSFLLNLVALGLFCKIDKRGFHKVDVGITYILLLATIAHDIIALGMFLLSDWTSVALTESDNPSFIVRILRKSLNVNRERWPDQDSSSTQHWTRSFGWCKQIKHRRWSESLCQYNLIHYCLNTRSEWLEKLIGCFGLTNMLDGLDYVETMKFTDGLRDLIFKEMKMKSQMADDLETAKEISVARGDWVLQIERCTELLPWINEVNFDASLLLWHIATDLCFHTRRASTAANTKDSNADDRDVCLLSKLLSDYMLYILIMQPTMMSSVAGIGKIRFRDTCADAKRFFCRRKTGKAEMEKKFSLNNIFAVEKYFCSCKSCMDILRFKKCCCKEKTGWDEVHKQACRSILDVDTVVKPVAVRGNRSKSVLFDACILAKELDKLGEERKWVIISKVWVEMLCYAACRCTPTSHVAELSKGGQLITLVWLLMAHFGLGDQFQIREGHARAKLIVEK
ncbi:uncharacterized protein LOC114286468 [Camellia sinensis]|uniref:DUF4220 domain-containing protein n=1 Tax=Camellia sinensis var. sinensis TaxID=542762 RepID=A0A4S4DUX6_CAMSN|nr:uncharacterized protein LOC114286468 [Camellia sinensis]THG07100.1 hypothetical protein TEA_022521 [Camellia sinensis var. sinensis]